MPRIIDGNLVGVYAYATDITLRIEAAQALTSARAEYAALRERRRISDEIHDAILQELFAAKLALEPRPGADGTTMRAHVDDARASVSRAVEDLCVLLSAA